VGIRETFQKGAKTVITAFGNVAVSTNYVAIASTGAYNASAGTVTVARTTVGGVKVIFDVFTIQEMDGADIRPEDKKALIAGKDLSTITPSVEDSIVEGGVEWNVVRVFLDPAGALYQFQVRRS
jgi:hypothetical protein